VIVVGRLELATTPTRAQRSCWTGSRLQAKSVEKHRPGQQREHRQATSANDRFMDLRFTAPLTRCMPSSKRSGCNRHPVPLQIGGRIVRSITPLVISSECKWLRRGLDGYPGDSWDKKCRREQELSRPHG
jgi:hypothetical protein